MAEMTPTVLRTSPPRWGRLGGFLHNWFGDLHTIIGAKKPPQFLGRLEGRVFEFFAKDKVVSIDAVRAE